MMRNSSDSLRIALVAPLWARLPPTTYGGIERIVSLTADELVRRGHRVTLFASGDSFTSAELHPVCEQNVLELMAQDRADTYEYYAGAAVAEALRRADEFDIIHFHLDIQWLPLAAVTTTPSLFTIHTAFSQDSVWAMRHYPQVAVSGISRCQVGDLEAACGCSIPVVYNGCDFDTYEPSFEPGRYLAYLGRMSLAKNPLGAIRIARSLGLPLVLAGQGQNPSEVRYFEEQIRPLIDGDQVRHIGPVDHRQKNELLRHAAALLFPIQWPEPFGLVMLEAMACGTPVVAHHLGAVAEVVDNGITGFHAASIDELAALVAPALALDRRRVREHAQARFGYDRMVDGYLELYRAGIAAAAGAAC